MDKQIIERYIDWKRKAKPDHRFAVGQVTYSQREMDALISGKVQKQINTTVIKEETYADVGESNSSGHSEDAGAGTSESAE